MFPNTFTLELLPGVFTEPKKICAPFYHIFSFSVNFLFVCFCYVHYSFPFSLFLFLLSLFLPVFYVSIYIFLSFFLSLFFLSFSLSLSFSLVICFCFDNTCLYSILVKQLSVLFRRWTTTKSCENNLPAS